MALTTSSTTPDPKKAADAKAANKPVEPVSAPGASDPAVLQLLADQATAVANEDNDAIAEINKKLNELGYK
jgi:hypothetical protein